MITATLGFAACRSASAGGDDLASADKSRELVVFVTNNAQEIREKALSFGLEVKSIDANAPSSMLIRALLNSPSDEYFAVINPVFRRYIAGGAVSDNIDPSEIDNLFSRLKLVSRAGEKQVSRLFPAKAGNARLVVFSDFQCPYCKAMEDFVTQWKHQYGDALEVEYIHFPLSFHQGAFPAAEAAECAREQGKFEPYKTELFEHQNELNEYVFYYVARRVKLDTKKFGNCWSLHKKRKAVRQDQYFGQYLGVSGTPTLFLNGQATGDQSPEQVGQAIARVLGKASDKQQAAAQAGQAEAVDHEAKDSR